MTRLLSPSDETIAQASDILKSGGLVAFPTETVYGLGADATSDTAVAKIFTAKGRPEFNPLIIHVQSIEMAKTFVAWTDAAEALAQQFWPGPLTFILPRLKTCPVSKLASAGLDTLAIRIPKHDVAQRLLREVHLPLAAPSANKSGRLSPTTPVHVEEDLGDAVDIILAGGRCAVGLESTVVDLSSGTPVILRSGAVTADELNAVLDIPTHPENDNRGDIKSPGQLLKHYAPKTPLRLNAVDVKEGEALLAFGSTKFIGVEGVGVVADMPEGAYRNLSESGDLTEAAANLFLHLHELDSGGFASIAVMQIPEEGLGVAINDRLRRAVC